MQFNHSKTQGVTILEVMLVMVISATVVVLGIKLYERFHANAEAENLKQNIDAIFDGGYQYYLANCSTSGALSSPTSSSVAVKLSTLKTSGYLNSKDIIPNELVDSGTADQDYIVQFNRSEVDRLVCLNDDCSEEQKIGNIVLWKIQVSAKLKNAETASAYQAYLVADCLSSLGTDDPPSVALCSAETPGDYIVFERAPVSIASRIGNQPPLALSMPRVDMLRQNESSLPLSYLLNSTDAADAQYYGCGGPMGGP